MIPPERRRIRAIVSQMAGTPSVDRRNRRQPEIVVATGDASLARMLEFSLNQSRLRHRIVTSGTRLLDELLRLPDDARPPIVVLDVDLPGVDGHAILERLGVEKPDTFLVIVLSSHADESVQVRSLMAGAADHLAKPFNIRVLLAKLQRWVALVGRNRIRG